MKLNTNIKLWFSSKNSKIFGEGPYLLLKKVEELGSLNKAAQSMHMSYSKAFWLLKNCEKELGYKLMYREVGGVNGGGSKLTENSYMIMEAFEYIKNEMDKRLEELTDEIDIPFVEIDEQ